MKKILAMLIVLSLLLPAAAALADDDTGVQIIGGPATESAPVSLDDMKIGETAKIEGFGAVTILSVEWMDGILRCDANGWNNNSWESGSEAQFLYLKVRILNTQKKAQNFLKMFSDIVCDYGDGYTFAGWCRQRSADDEQKRLYTGREDGYEISPLYAGQYGVIVTLPNLVVESKEPLSVTFKIGEHEFTYHHRR